MSKHAKLSTGESTSVLADFDDWYRISGRQKGSRSSRVHRGSRQVSSAILSLVGTPTKVRSHKDTDVEKLSLLGFVSRPNCGSPRYLSVHSLPQEDLRVDEVRLRQRLALTILVNILTHATTEPITKEVGSSWRSALKDRLTAGLILSAQPCRCFARRASPR